jgi:hypothetical protein
MRLRGCHCTIALFDLYQLQLTQGQLTQGQEVNDEKIKRVFALHFGLQGW